MKLIATKSFNLDGVFYDQGSEVKVKDKDELIRLNEKGFIEPLTLKEIQDFGKEDKIIRAPIIIEKEEE